MSASATKPQASKPARSNSARPPPWPRQARRPSSASTRRSPSATPTNTPSSARLGSPVVHRRAAEARHRLASRLAATAHRGDRARQHADLVEQPAATHLDTVAAFAAPSSTPTTTTTGPPVMAGCDGHRGSRGQCGCSNAGSGPAIRLRRSRYDGVRSWPSWTRQYRSLVRGVHSDSQPCHAGHGAQHRRGPSLCGQGTPLVSVRSAPDLAAETTTTRAPLERPSGPLRQGKDVVMSRCPRPPFCRNVVRSQRGSVRTFHHGKRCQPPVDTPVSGVGLCHL